MKTLSPTQITSDDIKQTEAFKEMSGFQQKLIMNKTNSRNIKNGYQICINRGVELWESQNKPSYQIKKIVIELINR